jgi:hypothetical protein
MALSMDEQRALAEIERRLAADDPGLATCMTAFRRPGPAQVLRSPRARIIGSLFTVLLVAMVSLMVYAMIPFRTHSNPPPSASTSASPAGAASSAAKSAAPSAGISMGSGQARSASSQAADQVASPATGP